MSVWLSASPVWSLISNLKWNSQTSVWCFSLLSQKWTVLWIRISIKLKGRIRICIKLKGRIRIRIKVISWIRIRINLQMTSQNVWNMSLFWHFFKVLIWAFIWKLGSGSASTRMVGYGSKWQAEARSGSASRWKEGSGSEPMWKVRSGSASMCCGSATLVDQDLDPRIHVSD